MLLSYDSFEQATNDIALSLKAHRTNTIDTSPYATMNMDVTCIGAPVLGKYILAAGHDQVYHFE